jgi:hypothetical protein
LESRCFRTYQSGNDWRQNRDSQEWLGQAYLQPVWVNAQTPCRTYLEYQIICDPRTLDRERLAIRTNSKVLLLLKDTFFICSHCGLNLTSLPPPRGTSKDLRTERGDQLQIRKDKWVCKCHLEKNPSDNWFNFTDLQLTRAYSAGFLKSASGS